MHDFNASIFILICLALARLGRHPPTDCSSRDSSAHDNAAPSVIDDR